MPEGFTAVLNDLDTNALLAAVVVFVVGGLFALVLRRFDIKDGVVFLTLLLLPFAVYGVGSGYISELTAPGGWGAKFRTWAGKDIEPTPLGDEIEDINIIEKSSLEALEQRRETLTPGRALAMTLQLGRGGYYNDRVIGAYTRTLLTFDPNLTVVFVDGDGRFVASSNGASVLAAMESGDQGQRLVDAIAGGDLLEIKRLVGHTNNAAKPGVTNPEAHDAMLRDGVESLIAVDDAGRPVGVVRRDDIVARLPVKLASG